MSGMLKAENVTVRYGARTVVQDLSFELKEGEWLMLVGPNGAGKSTLIEAIAGGVPYAGKITLAGRNIRAFRASELARRIGVLAQKNAVSYAYSVEEVVSLGRYAHASGFLASRDDDGGERVERALELTGLTELRRASVLTLSGGEPMMQPEPLYLIAKAAKEKGMNVWCYTGFTLENLLKENRADRMKLLSVLDVLVDGPFLSHERSLDLLYCGSKNQRLIDVPATLAAGEIRLYVPPEW